MSDLQMLFRLYNAAKVARDEILVATLEATIKAKVASEFAWSR